MTRRFDRSELAFFAVPRTWREIEMRFGSEAKTEPFRDCIILSDNEGGSGDLRYLREGKSWVLTDTGKHRVGDRLIQRELRVYPDKRALEAEREAAGEEFNAAMEASACSDVKEAFAGLLESPGPLESGCIEIPASMTPEQVEATADDQESREDELARLAAEQAEDA